MTQLNLFETKAERELFVEFEEKLKEIGEAVCPCCEHKTKIYKKRLPSLACASLIKLCKLYKQKPIAYHLRDFHVNMASHGFSDLHLWGLILRAKNIDPKKRTSGMYTPSEFGMKFFEGLRTVEKYAVTYNKKLIRYEGEEITIKQALGKSFDFSELMNDSENIKLNMEN